MSGHSREDVLRVAREYGLDSPVPFIDSSPYAGKLERFAAAIGVLYYAKGYSNGAEAMREQVAQFVNEELDAWEVAGMIRELPIPHHPGRRTRMRQEIDDPHKYRVSASGFSIKTGWGDDKRIVAKYPGTINPLDQQAYELWLKDAEAICEQHNALATANERIMELETQATGFVEGEPQIRWVYLENGRLNIAGRPTADDAAQHVEGVREVIATERGISDKLVAVIKKMLDNPSIPGGAFHDGHAALSEVAAIRKQGVNRDETPEKA